MSDDTINIRECYQCGRSHFVISDDPAEYGWVVCGDCGARVISAAELKQKADLAQERRIRDNLQVEEFLKARRVDKDG